MLSSFNYELAEQWPPYAWLARCTVDSTAINMFHGPAVETRRQWFCEAIWTEPFGQGGFDTSETVFGSGGRLRDGRAVFVSSSATVDRLHSAVVGDVSWVSNSLPCLLASVGGRFDPAYSRYMDDLRSIVGGFRDYRRVFETTACPVSLTYHDNLVWCDGQLRPQPKLHTPKDISSFDQYVRFMRAGLADLVGNMRSVDRSSPLEPVGTVSAGYDSSTVACLASQVGLREVLTLAESRDGKCDSGAEVARHLGLNLVSAHRDDWLAIPMAEIPFLAGDGNGQEANLVAFSDRLTGRVLLTGFYGDDVWGTGRTAKPDGTLRRLGQSGLGFTEARLWLQTIHLPVPFLGARQRAEIRAISLREEMKPWSVGGTYDRPIPRRILEEAGVPRTAFGIQKLATSVRLSVHEAYRSPGLGSDYSSWLQDNARHWWRRGRIPPHVSSKLLRPPQSLARLGSRAVQWIGQRRGRRYALRKMLWVFGTRDPRYRYVFPWAVERATEQKYAAYWSDKQADGDAVPTDPASARPSG